MKLGTVFLGKIDGRIYKIIPLDKFGDLYACMIICDEIGREAYLPESHFNQYLKIGQVDTKTLKWSEIYYAALEVRV